MIEISKDKDILIFVRLEKYFNFNNYESRFWPSVSSVLW
jgi:hypothetical protein